jgi:hypothetical protein
MMSGMMSGIICRDLMIMYTIILLLSVYLIFNFYYFLHCIHKVIKEYANVAFIHIINILLYISNISLLVLAIHYYKNIKPFTKNTNVNNITASLVLSIINFFGLLVNLYFCVPNYYSSDSFLFFYQINYAIFNVLLIVSIMILFSIEIYRNNNRHPLSSSNNAILPPPQRSNTAGTTPPVYSSGSRFSFLG